MRMRNHFLMKVIELVNTLIVVWEQIFIIQSILLNQFNNHLLTLTPIKINLNPNIPYIINLFYLLTNVRGLNIKKSKN